MRLPVRPFPPVGIVAAHLGRPAVRHLHGYDGLVRLLAYPCPPPPVSLGSRVWVALDHTRFGRRWGASLLPTLRPQVTRPGARLATGLSATALTGLDFHQLDSFEGFHQLMLSYDDASLERHHAICWLLEASTLANLRQVRRVAAVFIAVAAVMFLPPLSILAFRRPLLDPLAH
jgi:hypothetical protein